MHEYIIMNYERNGAEIDVVFASIYIATIIQHVPYV